MQTSFTDQYIAQGDALYTIYGILKITQKPFRLSSGYADAKKELQGLIQGETVIIDTKARDKYNRAVANVKLGNKSVNNAMKSFKKKK